MKLSSQNILSLPRLIASNILFNPSRAIIWWLLASRSFINGSNNELSVYCQILMVDHERFAKNVRCNYVREKPSAHIDSKSAFFSFDLCCGGEVRAVFDLKKTIEDPDGGVYISGNAVLYEGDDCETSDSEDEESIQIYLAKDSCTEHKVYLRNRGFGGGDSTEINCVLCNISTP